MRRRLSLRPLWLAVPLLFIVFFLGLNARLAQSSGQRTDDRFDGAAALSPKPTNPSGRLLIVIVDSLRRSNLEAPGLMPNLVALAESPDASLLDVHTCASNFSLPCIQTIFSGRESPMSSGIEQFSSYGASQGNVFEALSAAGLRVAVVGNEMLSTLYGRSAAARYSVVPLRLDPLASDIAAIAQAGRYLDDPAIDVVLLHTSGTDHTTHFDLPGSAAYVRHFHAVDAALSGLLDRVDHERDAIVVMGDHGHDNDGHHARHSVAIFAGRSYRDLFAQLDLPTRTIEQRDLLYFLSYPDLVTMQAGYEGRFFAIRPATRPAPRLATFLDLQRRHLIAASREESAGARSRAVADRMQPNWHRGNEEAWRQLADALPLLACLFLCLVWVSLSLASGGLSPVPVIGSAALALVVSAAQRYLSAPALPLAAVPLLLAGWLAVRQGGRRLAAACALLLAGAAATAAVEPAWRTFFHSRDEFHWAIPVFYLALLVAGAGLAKVRKRGAEWWPSATQLVALVALPAGVYYYQFAENPLRGYLIPALVLLSWRKVTGIWRGRRRSGRAGLQGEDGAAGKADSAGGSRAGRWPAVLALVASSLAVMPQDAGGWQWHSWIARKLTWCGDSWSMVVYALVAAWLLVLLDSWRHRLPLAALLLALPFFVVAHAGLTAEQFAAAFVVVLFACAWMTARARGDAEPGAEDETVGLMLAAAAVAIALTTCEGFAIEHIDFTFALRYAGFVRSDPAVGAIAAPLVAIKYASPIIVMLAFHRALRGAAATERGIAFMLAFLTLKVLALFLQVLTGALDSGEKFFELAQTDLIFIGSLAIAVAMWTVVLWIGDLLVSAARRPARIGGTIPAWPESRSTRA